MNDYSWSLNSNPSDLIHYGILGMKWGVRRYQNTDGTYTSLGLKRRNGGGSSEDGKWQSGYPQKSTSNRYIKADGMLTTKGQKRYERDIKENEHRKKDKKVDTSKPDVNRWIKEDRERTKNAVDRARDLTNSASQGLDAYASLKRHNAETNRKKQDLSKYSDQELRNAINRAMLERQYNDIFNAPETTKGAEKVKDVVQITGAGLGIVSAGLGIALAVKELKG